MAFQWRMPATVERVIDGDTVVCSIKLAPWLELKSEHVRVEGINAPEISTANGKIARDFAATLLPVGAQVVLTMHTDDKYGRVLAKIELPDSRDFSTVMVDSSHAVPFMV